MTKQIILEESLKLVSFKYDDTHGWQILDVKSDVTGDIYGDIYGDVESNIHGNVWGTINGRKWIFIETRKEKFQRLLQGTRNQELIDAFNQMENK